MYFISIIYILLFFKTFLLLNQQQNDCDKQETHYGNFVTYLETTGIIKFCGQVVRLLITAETERE